MKNPTRNDDWLIPALLVLVGLIPVVREIATREPFGPSATIGLLMLVLGAAGLGAALRGRHREGT